MIIETKGLILRKLKEDDDMAMFELDSDPEVHKYLGNNPYTTLVQSRETIASVQRQYAEHGIGRWAADDVTYLQGRTECSVRVPVAPGGALIRASNMLRVMAAGCFSEREGRKGAQRTQRKS